MPRSYHSPEFHRNPKITAKKAQRRAAHEAAYRDYLRDHRRERLHRRCPCLFQKDYKNDDA